MSHFGKFQRSLVIDAFTRYLADSIEGVHPFRQVMEILTVAIPFQMVIKFLIGLVLILPLTNS